MVTTAERSPHARFLGLRAAVALAAMLAACLVLLLPAAPAQAAPWVKIQAPDRIKAAKKLTFRVACRDACRLVVTTKLVWPNRPNLVSTIQGTFRAGESRANILTLNNPARHTLKANFRRTTMQVIVRAANLDTGARGTVRRSFKFRP